MGMLLAIVLLAGFAVALAAILISRHHHKSATATTVIVTTTAATTTPTTTAAAKPKAKLLLPVPSLVGSQWKQASAGLRRAGFHVSFASVRSALPRGTVTAQDPKAGAKVAKGSDVRLNISTGTGQQKTTTAPQQATTAPATTPAATTPAATTTPATTAATTTTTAAQTTTATPQPATSQVPTLSGDLQPALQQLDQAGFHASVAYVPGTQPLGTVIAQSPAGGASAKAGSQVTVNVSSGPGGNPEETVPNVVGQRIPQALDALHAAGLRLVLLNMRVSDRSKAGVIVVQTPLPGKHAPKNAQILVYLGAFRQ